MSLESRHVFVAPIEGVECRKSNDRGQITMAGHASVFDRLSHDLGGFREKVDRSAFDVVLDGDPDVHLLWDHDTSRVLARTRNKTLDLRRDPIGLHFWGKAAPTSYAQDLAILLERRDVDQASFAFTIEEDDWDMQGDTPIRTIRKISELYDVTITAKGAYPQTDASLRTLQDAISRKRIPGLSVERAQELAGREQIWLPDLAVGEVKATVEVADIAAPLGADEPDAAERSLDVQEQDAPLDIEDAPEAQVAPEEAGIEESNATDLVAELQSSTRARRDEVAESVLRLLKEHGLH